MKQFRFLATTLAASMFLFLFSCGSGDSEKKPEDKMPDSTQTKTAETPTPPTPFKPSELMVIQHKVSNFAKWKPAYESHDSVRLANGLSNYVIARGIDDSNMVLVALKMSDLEKAKAMAASPEMKDRMKKGGVIGMPSINFIEQVMQDTATIPQTARVSIIHKVKDWAAWKKEFDSHKQARMDAGLIDRVVGHNIGDDHMVRLVFAITDMAKAKAFMNSKDLKDKMTAAGVEGPPTVFFYNIVQLYK